MLEDSEFHIPGATVEKSLLVRTCRTAPFPDVNMWIDSYGGSQFFRAPNFKGLHQCARKQLEHMCSCLTATEAGK